LIVGAILKPDIASSLGLFAFLFGVLAFTIGYTLWMDTLPADFSLAEGVKLHLYRLVERCKAYNDVHDDPSQRGQAAKRCRVTIKRLFFVAKRYSLDESTSSDTSSDDLFVGDLSDFALSMARLLPRLSGIIQAEVRIPFELVQSLEAFLRQTDQDPAHYDSGKRKTMDEAIGFAEGTGKSADHDLAIRPFARFASMTRSVMTSLSPTLQLVFLLFIVSIAYWVLYLLVPEIESALSPAVWFYGHFALLTVLVAAFGVIRKRT
jgi:hypothetical protein